MKNIYITIVLLFLTIRVFATEAGNNLYIPSINDIYLPTNYTKEINISMASSDSNSEILYDIESSNTSVVTAYTNDAGITLHSGSEENKTALITLYAVIARHFGDSNIDNQNTIKLIDENLSAYIGEKELNLLASNWYFDSNETNFSSLLDIKIPIESRFINKEQNSTNCYNTSLKLAIYNQKGKQFIFEIDNLVLETVGDKIKLKLVAGQTSISIIQTGLQKLDGVLSNNAMYSTIVEHSVNIEGLHINLDILKEAVNTVYNDKINNIEAILSDYYDAENSYNINFELKIDDNVSLLTNLPVEQVPDDNILYFDKNITIGKNSFPELNITNSSIAKESFLVHVIDNNTSINPPPFPPNINTQINISEILPVSPLILEKNFGEKIIPLAIYNESNSSATLNAESNDTSVLLATIQNNNLVLKSVQDKTGIVNITITSGSNSVVLEVYVRGNLNETTIHVPRGWSLLSFPTKGKLDAMDIYDTFGSLNIKAIVKYNGGFWSYWDSDSEVKPQYNIPKFSTLSSKEGFWIKANNNETIKFPLDPSNNDQNDLLRFKYYKNGWFLVGLNRDITPNELSTLIKNKSGKSVYLMYIYRDAKWQLYTPDSEFNSKIKNEIPRIEGDIYSKEGIWVLLK